MSTTNPTPWFQVMEEALADGQWHDGWQVFRRMERSVPPGIASRRRASERSSARDVPMDKLIASGRRDIVHTVLAGAIKRGKVQVEGGLEFTRRDWQEEKPFRIRKPLADAVSVAQLAESMAVPGVTANVIRGWVSMGFVPVTHNESGHMCFTPAQAEVVRQVALLYPGKGVRRWPRDPRTLWNSDYGAPAETHNCPHCGQALTITTATTVTLEKE